MPPAGLLSQLLKVMHVLGGSRVGIVRLPDFHLPTERRRRDWQHNVRRQALRIAVNPSRKPSLEYFGNQFDAFVMSKIRRLF